MGEISDLDLTRPSEPLEARLRSAPRCGAKTRAGTPCLGPAVHGRARCRMHGGKSPGGPCGAANGRYSHGERTKEAKAFRRAAAALRGSAQALLKGLEGKGRE